MAITFGSVGSFPASPFTSGGSTIACPYPSGIAAGDALILCAVNSNPDSWNTPAGWTSKEANANVLTDMSCSVFTTVATGSESGTLSVVHAANTPVAVCITRHTGVAASPFGDTASSVSTVDTGTASPTNGALSPAPGATDMVVRFYAYAQRASSTGGTLSNPGGTWTTRLNLMSNLGSFNCGIVVADKIAGTDDQTVNSNTAGAFMVVDVDLVAAASSVAPPYPGLLTARLRPYFG